MLSASTTSVTKPSAPPDNRVESEEDPADTQGSMVLPPLPGLIRGITVATPEPSWHGDAVMELGRVHTDCAQAIRHSKRRVGGGGRREGLMGVGGGVSVPLHKSHGSRGRTRSGHVRSPQTARGTATLRHDSLTSQMTCLQSCAVVEVRLARVWVQHPGPLPEVVPTGPTPTKTGSSETS